MTLFYKDSISNSYCYYTSLVSCFLWTSFLNLSIYLLLGLRETIIFIAEICTIICPECLADFLCYQPNVNSSQIVNISQSISLDYKPSLDQFMESIPLGLFLLNVTCSLPVSHHYQLSIWICDLTFLLPVPRKERHVKGEPLLAMSLTNTVISSHLHLFFGYHEYLKSFKQEWIIWKCMDGWVMKLSWSLEENNQNLT